MNVLESLSVLDFVYIIVGLVLTVGVGSVLFAFALSYISQKVAMWVDVRKLVKHRDILMLEVQNLKTHIKSIEGLVPNDVVAPVEIGVEVVK